MITTYIIFFISLWIHECRSQECAKENPFYMIDRQCANFNDICVRKDSGPCKSLLQACAQCPASNLTESALVSILTILRDQRSKTTNEFKKIENSSFAMIILIVISFVVILLFLIDMRFHIFNRYCRKRANGRRYHINREEYKALIKEYQRSPSGAKSSAEKDAQTNNLITASINMRGFTNPIEIQINREDNVVKIKQKICAKMMNTKSYHFKMMVLKLNGTRLDDNQYLDDKICLVDDSLHCDVIEILNQNEIVVVMLRGNICLPEMIQFNRFQPIEELKSDLSKLTGVAADSLKLFRDSNEVDELDEMKKLDNLDDYKSLYVIEIRKRKITIESIFDHIDPVPLSYSNVESIGTIKNKIANLLGSHADNIILFCGNKNLNDNVFIFETGIEQGRELKFCHLMPTDKLDKITFVTRGDLSEIFEGKNPWTMKEMVLKKYQLEPMKKLKENKAFLNELTTFQITKSHGGFVHLNGIFKEKDYFYISMEKMEGSLKPRLTKDPLLPEEIIAKWAKQILSALKYLHDHGIIHRNIKPSNILLDKAENIKLSSFGVSKYVHCGDKKYLMEGFKQSQSGTYRYMAPEVCNNENSGAPADVWSFGATLIEMATGKEPFDGMNESKALMEIAKIKQIPFILDQKRTPKIKEFIDRCLIANPHIRATVEKLLNHDFLCS